MSDMDAGLADAGMEESACGSGSPFNGKLGLRVAAIFVIAATSLIGTLFPIASRRVRALKVPEWAYSIAKYFGSGVIIATAFIHLLAPAWDSLTSDCLTGAWTEYDWAPAIAMFSVFLIFIAELTAHRAGASYLRKRNIKPLDQHTEDTNAMAHSTHGAHVTAGPSHDHAHKQGVVAERDDKDSFQSDLPESLSDLDEKAFAQIVGVAILEFGVIFHSLIIGLTLAVDPDFSTLFVVIVFHQMFEGLGLGSRLSVLPLPRAYNWFPFLAGTTYALITPLGIAIGLGVRHTYNPESATAVIVSGILDALSAGILLYTGLVELLAHDFIFNRAMINDASNLKVAASVGCVLLGAGLMALLGRWA